MVLIWGQVGRSVSLIARTLRRTPTTAGTQSPRTLTMSDTSLDVHNAQPKSPVE